MSGMSGHPANAPCCGFALYVQFYVEQTFVPQIVYLFGFSL